MSGGEAARITHITEEELQSGEMNQGRTDRKYNLDHMTHRTGPGGAFRVLHLVVLIKSRKKLASSYLALTFSFFKKNVTTTNSTHHPAAP